MATAISLLLAVYAWRRRPATGSTLFALLMLSVVQWTVAYSLEVTSTDLAIKLIWAKVQYLGIVILPVAWLAFALEYTGRESWLSAGNLSLLALIPALTFLLVMTNEAHGLMWRRVVLYPTLPFPTLVREYGEWFWVFTAFSYGCFLVASVYLFTGWRSEVTWLYRGQSIALLLGLLMPWAAHALYVAGLTAVDLTPFGFSLSGLVLAIYMLQLHLFDMAPVAYRAVMDSMVNGLLVVDRQGRIVDLNTAVQDILHQPAPELLGKPIDAVHPRLGAFLHDSPDRSLEITLGPAEKQRYYEAAVSHLQDWRKKSRGHLLILHDITARKKVEQMRDDMTRAMVHDLRAPISNSWLALEMFKKDLPASPPAGDHELLELTFANMEKTLDLVNNILEVSRLESGKMPLSCRAIDLPQLIAGVLKAQASRAAKKQVQLHHDVASALPPAWADASLVERVLQNLVDNGIKFSPAGGTVSVTAVPAPAGTNAATASPCLLISVSDSGPGIPPAFKERLFEKFTTNGGHQAGSGLGLAFCKMALAAHDETIWVDSKAGQGATFHFTLAISPQKRE